MLQRTMTDSFVRPQVLMLVLLFCWGSVHCHDTVKGATGEDVTLPCNFNQSLSQTNKVFWRGANDSIVLDIIGGKAKLENQDKKYKDRVSFLQDGYNNGNVSIIMKNLQSDDAGTYTCTLLPESDTKKVNLTVTDKRAIKTTTSPSDGAAGTKVLSVVLLSVLSLLLCF
ncbi:CD276 antigen homolog [Austrofundulus limnaeus]|uniref:CD276 antigen homolog n=1 Tax=Austrofundulus limnaeus TaxID=52670 RepID=A0A2I4DD91_AUSLI|nr:PREDICTED: CD276 antigen homolog [Austrofundulus limnaeus]